MDRPQPSHPIMKLYEHHEIENKSDEEIISVLLAIYQLGGRPSKEEVTRYVINYYWQRYNDDDELVSTGEERVINRIAWVRQNLKDRGFIGGEIVGIWDITDLGGRFLLARAEGMRRSRDEDWGNDIIFGRDTESNWQRLTPRCIEDLMNLV
jgi:restriction endonuclease Mrr